MKAENTTKKSNPSGDFWLFHFSEFMCPSDFHQPVTMMPADIKGHVPKGALRPKQTQS